MAKNTTTTITVTVTADALLKIVTGAMKGVTLSGMATTAINEPAKPKTYDATTCTVIKGNAKLDSLLEGYKGEGALKRLMAENGLDYTVASPLLSAWKAARKAKRDELFIVPSAAEKAKAFVDSLAPKAVLVKAKK